MKENFNYNFVRKFLWHNTDLSKKKFFKNNKKFTLKYSLSSFIRSHHILNKSFFTKVLNVNLKIKNRVKHSKHLNREIYNFLNHSDKTFNERLMSNLILTYSKKNHVVNFLFNKLNTLFNVNFIRKEKIYTKLKYSRVPQYDSVSGGSAAILAGFLGYLITEKFGLELLDSGDFWFFFMYIVFLVFSFYPLTKIVSETEWNWSVLNYKWGYFFYTQILFLFFAFIVRVCTQCFYLVKFYFKNWK